MKKSSQPKSKKEKADLEHKDVAAREYTDRGTIYDEDPNRDNPEIVNDEGAIELPESGQDTEDKTKDNESV